MVRRFEREAKRCGNHESIAIFAITLGPSTKPVCAATIRSNPSDRMVIKANRYPARHLSNKILKRVAFRVCPLIGLISKIK
ncbi:MAG: hypothetical protein AABZ11_00585 [Nitrospinota bacterium]